MSQVKIRTLSKTDINAFAAIVGDEQTAKQAGFVPPANLAAAKTMLAQELATGQGLAIIVNNVMCGCIFSYQQLMDDGQPDRANREIAFMMNHTFSNRGIMSDALHQFITKLVQHGQVQKLVANVKRGNFASQCVLLHNQFTIVGSFTDLAGGQINQFQLMIVNQY